MTGKRTAKADVMNGSKPAQQRPTTLTQVHETLVRIRPNRDASLREWQSYYQRSVALYAEIAEIDRGHHHEALYWAEREQEKAKEIADLIKKGATSWDPYA